MSNNNNNNNNNNSTMMKVELSIHALKLKNVAGAFKGTSDPFAVVTLLATEPGKTPTVLGKTEVVQNTLSPQWVKVFVIDYALGTPCRVAINIFDQVRKGDQKSMGSAVFDVNEVLGARGNIKCKKIKNGGTIFCSVRKAQGSGLMRLQLKGNKLKNVEGMFSKSDPFFEILRQVNQAGGLTWDNVYRSESVKNTLDPAWETAVLDLSIVCGGNLDLPLKIQVFDFESSGRHKGMGSCEMSVKGFQQAAASGTPVKLLQSGKDVGTLTIVKAEVSGVVADVTEKLAATSIGSSAMPTPAPFRAATNVTGRGTPDFVDYVSGGCELNVVVAIDFTGSNGDPRIPGALHYIDPNSMNDYEMAINAILSILAKYDSDQKFPVVGFGAKYGGVVRHCFQCGPTAEAHGVEGVLKAYEAVFKSGLIMSGPTVFTEVIEMAAARAQSSLEQAQRVGSQSYTILLILTDGAVTDPGATAAALERVSANSPLSVVIVGVGNADFSSMRFLDDVASGPGKRDVAQFVEFNRHRHSSSSLTSETLNEIPTQLVQFFQSKGMQPHPPLKRSDSTVSVGEAEEEINLSLDIREDEEIVITAGGDDFVDGFKPDRTHI